MPGGKEGALSGAMEVHLAWRHTGFELLQGLVTLGRPLYLGFFIYKMGVITYLLSELL